MITGNTEATRLHKLFCELTNFDLRLNYIRESIWVQFSEQEFTEEDLRLVVRWIKAQMNTPRSGYDRRSLMFNNFFANGLTNFEDRLELAKQEFKIRKRLPEKQIPVTQTVAPGQQITRLDNPPPAEPQPIGPAIHDQVEQLRKEFYRK